MSTEKSLSAPNVAAALRRARFDPVSPADHAREGVRVRRGLGGGVTVSADLDDGPRARALATEVGDALRELGYTVEPVPETLVRVNR